MFREMRRKRQALSPEAAAGILERGSFGVLALSGDDGYPYAVPLSYAYDRARGAILFHCAQSGHKLDAIRRCGKASFCVVDQDQVVPEAYTTYFRSAIAFGTVRELTEEAERREAIALLALRYAPQDTDRRRQEVIDREGGRMSMLELSIAHLTGKEAIELVRQREEPDSGAAGAL